MKLILGPLSFAGAVAVMLSAVAVTALGQTSAGSTNTAKTAPKLEDLLPDEVVAKGKGFEVKRSALDEALVAVRANIAARGQEITQNQLALLEKETLDDLILLRILNNKATAEQKAAGKEDGDKAFEAFKKQAPSEELFVRQLKAMGTTPEKLQLSVNEKAIARMVLRDKVNISDGQVKKFYDENPGKFEEPERARISYITMGAPDPRTGVPMADDKKAAKRKQLEDILKRARGGEEFAKLAREFSEDLEVSRTGGEVVLARDQAGVPAEFIAKAFSLQTNQISDIITTLFGYHIIKLSEKFPAHKVELSEAKTSIRNYLENLEVNRIMPEYYPQLKKEANVEILDEKLKALESIPSYVPPQTEPATNAKPKTGIK